MRKGGMKVEVEDSELERSIQNLAEVVIENLKSGPNHEYEPFEAYSKKVRVHIYENIDQFHHRFLRGYEVLLEEILNEKK